jgi:hypothetical protein
MSPIFPKNEYSIDALFTLYFLIFIGLAVKHVVMLACLGHDATSHGSDVPRIGVIRGRAKEVDPVTLVKRRIPARTNHNRRALATCDLAKLLCKKCAERSAIEPGQRPMHGVYGATIRRRNRVAALT